ncbi:MAG: low-specificity L-threonine aldolase [Proteobacteria bacterium]|nr:low-specificity L-threonine aldolase [Pseudomonadota bacterium]
MRSVDLRSDTVTLPSEAMREAMAHAAVGDDVFGEDPSVNRLQEMAAELVGKEAALFVPSGTMANLICLLSHSERGDEIYLGDLSHIFLNEAGGSAAVGGLHPRTLCNNEDGTLNIEDIEAAVRPDNVHFPHSRLLCLENTHNRCWGSPLSLKYLGNIFELTGRLGLKTHLDGARIFNAALAEDVEVSKLTKGFDSVSFCFSKGLGAPVGSVICGSRKFIQRTARIRKQLGGGMRQAGIIAAGGIYALEHMVKRLAEDHTTARRLAEGIDKIDGLETQLERVRTNILFFDLVDKRLTTSQLLERAATKGVLFLYVGNRRFRMVTHYGLTMEDIDWALKALQEVMATA